MSSILDALKKAERESAIDRSAGTPWPAPLPMQSPYRKRSLRWWVLLGIVGVVCVAGVTLWQVRQPDTTPPPDSISAAAPLPLPKPDHRVTPPVAEAPPPNLPVADPAQAPPVKTPMDASPGQATANAPASEAHVPDPMVVVTPVQPGKRPLPRAIPKSDPVIAPVQDPAPRPAETAVASQPAAAPLNAGKFFKSDPRIDLQALVWAPDSTARFVVINNRLIKEGGSVDNIVVVRINPDDVLLAEGSDQWHEAFKIR
ncbi:general secretion pathway protein GspB [Desulfosarcina sp.]|uniref:general secretion pathway protein GspB n=1 Tax=Desulfosarcina sp. TaxID=2027861 RepID=UPI0029AA53FE|nr:general secretion pathway protein GspB [Desulfosarcina sp.]MDX2452781.1 general secretion pathway protein GspB [Desulfosarcina sp.]MDX2490532.1 general secretion pathway protein GspB [Desulfosarcina sp.]